MSLRSESKGISPTRGKEASRCGFNMPNCAPAITSALSVGSPSARNCSDASSLVRPTLVGWRTESLQRTPPAAKSATEGLSCNRSAARPASMAANGAGRPRRISCMRLTSCPATSRMTTVIRFSVSVPVLSEQMTVTEPSVSTAGRRLMRACRLSMRCAPSESDTVTMAGSPSGTAATAMLTAVRNMMRTSSPRRRPSAKMTATSTSAATASHLPSWASRFWSGVVSTLAPWIMPAIRPSSVSIPVATTTASPRP
ncbi:MAG: hypothetical protein BWY79_01103 [Actinobacteria bacterium ADurb.Bin444]|nr:MAG: hypothetical protein BWY79_01103 [Actinobacteria bacterium ADurb.Bin444]